MSRSRDTCKLPVVILQNLQSSRTAHRAKRRAFCYHIALSSASTMTSKPSHDLIQFLRTSFPNTVPAETSDYDLSQLSSQVYPTSTFSDSEKVEVYQWLITSSHIVAPDEDEAKRAERLDSLNTHLSTRTTLLGSKPSVADLALFHRLGPVVEKWGPEKRTGERGYHHIVRHLDFVQNSPLFGLRIQTGDKISINPNEVLYVRKPVDAKDEKERRKKEKAATSAEAKTTLPLGRSKEASQHEPNSAAAETSEQSAKGATVKKEKKEKAPKQPKQPAQAPLLSPRLIDLRVGHILKAIHHPDADSLFVSTIACGDVAGTENTSEYEGQVVRTVCSGLNGLIPLEEMQGRRVITVCNLKPVTMRGIKSSAMVLAASPRLKEGEVDDHSGPVELVDPPEDAVAGERVLFDGWEGEPEGQLNPKKKVFETLQPGFTTSPDGVVSFDSATVEATKEQNKSLGALRTKQGGACKVKSLIGAVVR